MANLSRFGGVPRSSIFLTEAGAAGADAAAYGQIWIKDDVPNELWFTDDAGNDKVISGLKIETEVFRPYDFEPAPTVSRNSITNAGPTLLFAESGVTYGQAHTTYSMPKRWDGGQMRWRFKWTPTTTNTGSTQFYLIGHFQTEGDAITSGGTANMTITDTPNGTIDDVHTSPWSSWQTIDGTGDEDKLFVFRIQRQGPTDAFTGGVNLLHMELQYTTDTMTDE